MNYFHREKFPNQYSYKLFVDQQHNNNSYHSKHQGLLSQLQYLEY